MYYSDNLPHFTTNDPAPVNSKEAESAEIARKVAEYEKTHGPVTTSPIRRVPKLKRLSKQQTKVAMRKKTFA